MANKKGLIIYFDGPDGVGKTSQLKLTANDLRGHGHAVHPTRTLGGTHIGEMLRDVMLTETERPVQTDLHIALACQYALAEKVLKLREEGEIVLIDRSPLSIIGYQVFADGIDRGYGYAAAQGLLDLIKPDLILVYAAPGKELERRRRQRNHDSGHDYFEVKPLSYHQKVADGFDEAARRFDARVIDASGDADHVFDATLQQVLKILKA
jgi:dTMP kinase